MSRAERVVWRLAVAVLCGGAALVLMGMAYWLLTMPWPAVLYP